MVYKLSGESTSQTVPIQAAEKLFEGGSSIKNAIIYTGKDAVRFLRENIPDKSFG